MKVKNTAEIHTTIQLEHPMPYQTGSNDMDSNADKC